MSPTLRLSAVAFCAASLVLADCSNSASPFVAIPSPSASPAQVTAVIPPSGGSIALPQASNGENASLGIGAGAPSGATITASVSTAAPANAVAPSVRRRSGAPIAGAVPFLFVTFTVSQTVSASVFASEVVSVLSTFPSPAAYYGEFDDITSAPGTKLGCAGPGTVANLTVTIINNAAFGACTNASTAAPTLVPGRRYLLQFYYVPGTPPSPTPTMTPSSTPTSSPTSTPTSSPTATPAPTATPTRSPAPTAAPIATPTPTPGPVVVTPSSLYFTGSSPAPQTFTATQSGFSGTFTTTNTCAGYATISGTSPTFTVMATAAPSSTSSAPTCAVTVSNGIGGTAVVNVYISTVGVIVNTRGGRP